jgi:hypothetical protein
MMLRPIPEGALKEPFASRNETGISVDEGLLGLFWPSERVHSSGRERRLQSWRPRIC